jgi:Flp pilus assembly protein TadG
MEMKQRVPVRNRRRRGAYFVELAFTLTPMLALMFAIVDYSMPIFFRSLMMHAVREGSRFAITYRTLTTGQTHTAAIQDVVMEQSAGFLNGTTGRNKIQVHFYNQVTFAEDTGANRNAPGNIVEVSVNDYQWTHILPLFREATRTVSINASSADRLESLPAGGVPPSP